MARKKMCGKVLGVIAWITGIIVSLVIGFAMIGGTLPLPAWLGGSAVAMVAGWALVIMTGIGALFAVIHAATK